MAEKPVRVGIIGAGANTRSRHIPGLRAVSGVEIVGVVNRSPESGEKVAKEFGIPKVYNSWQAVVEDPQVDAICIGTWPNMHCEITCAALNAGKHVLCEARMARNAAEAHQMFAAAQANPGLIAQLVPSPFGLVQEPFIRSIYEHSFIGTLREVVVIGAEPTYWDYTEFFHWRQDAKISGLNVLTMGILHETVSRWIPATTRVIAQTTCFEKLRPLPNSQGLVNVTVPDSVQVITQIDGGARGIYHFSGITLFGPGKQIHLYGSRGTLKYVVQGDQESLYTGRPGDADMKLVELPENLKGKWRVEAEFIAAVRGQDRVYFTDFAAGIRYMEFTEAVARSAALNLPVDLPLKNL